MPNLEIEENELLQYLAMREKIRQLGEPPDFIGRFLASLPEPYTLPPREVLDHLYSRQMMPSWAILGALFPSHEGLARTDIREAAKPLLIAPKPKGLDQSTLHRALARMEQDKLVTTSSTKPPKYAATTLGRVLFLGHVELHARNLYQAASK